MSCLSPNFSSPVRAQAFEICLHISRDGKITASFTMISYSLILAAHRDQLRENGAVTALLNALQSSYSLEITRMTSQTLAFMSENGS
jgi:hypothetical protein